MNDSTPKVTVIMAVYNKERFVAEAIESVLNQTFRDFEFIICDDGSTDKSRDIIMEYAKRDGRISFILNQNNMGIPKTMNRMLKEAKGFYACGLGADDAFMPNRLEVAVKFMDENTVSATYSDYYQMDENGKIINEIACAEFDMDRLLASEYINDITIMYIKSCFEAIGFYDEELKYSQDSLMKLEIGKQYGFTRIPAILAKYRMHSDSITAKKADEQRKYLEVSKSKFREKYPEFREAKVTIGVPVYNPNMGFLKECFESIKGQTYKNYHVIVLDDGSDFGGHIKAMADEYGFIYFHQENKGIGGARNAIIDLMLEDSEYLCYLSYDDIMHQDYLKAMVQEAKKYRGCVLYSNFLIINDHGQVIMQHEVPMFETFEDFCVCCLSYAERDNMFVNFSTTFFPADIIRRERFDDSYKYGEDLEFLLRTALVKKCVYAYIPELLAKIRMHIDSATTKKMEEIPKNNAKILEKIRGLLNGKADG